MQGTNILDPNNARDKTSSHNPTTAGLRGTAWVDMGEQPLWNYFVTTNHAEPHKQLWLEVVSLPLLGPNYDTLLVPLKAYGHL